MKTEKILLELKDIKKSVMLQNKKQVLKRKKEKEGRKMENIYLVVEEWATDYEQGRTAEAFKNEKDADKRLSEKIKDFKKDCEEWATDFDTIENEEKLFSVYNKGCYLENHTTIYIEILGVK